MGCCSSRWCLRSSRNLAYLRTQAQADMAHVTQQMWHLCRREHWHSCIAV
jgi:hypothetical protein